MKAKIDFGKINLYGTGKRYPVEITIELKKHGGEKTYINGQPTGETTPEYIEFTASGHAGAACWGQCLDSIVPYLKRNKLFNEVYSFWKKYHLNGMHAGTPDQEKAIKEKEASGWRYDYTEACEYLKSIGLYEVNYTGLACGHRYNNEPYKYGHGWLIQEIPASDLERIEHIINTINAAKEIAAL